MNNLQQNRRLCQPQNRELLEANARLYAKRAERARLKAEGKLEGGGPPCIPTKTAGELVDELMRYIESRLFWTGAADMELITAGSGEARR